MSEQPAAIAARGSFSSARSRRNLGGQRPVTSERSRSSGLYWALIIISGLMENSDLALQRNAARPSRHLPRQSPAVAGRHLLESTAARSVPRGYCMVLIETCCSDARVVGITVPPPGCARTIQIWKQGGENRDTVGAAGVSGSQASYIHWCACPNNSLGPAGHPSIARCRHESVLSSTAESSLIDTRAGQPRR